MGETLRNGKKKAVLDALRGGNTRQAAAAAAGICSATLYRWLDGDEKLRETVEQAEMEAERKMVASILAAAIGAEEQEQDWRAAAWYLERRSPAFANKETLNILQRVAREVVNASDEQLGEILAGSQPFTAAGDPGAPGGGGAAAPPAGAGGEPPG